ncbi:SMI1/KNR4 family protein [Saccharibacillus sp. CPCC 101409]|uniref:SMI1/KNR4 family protein n=1 Tax=Saccharibacillus sp. CPCC 101409 TaxID=3058041 RepID=UPI002672724C|nr:SMI1/KNR4 family protein [Saccharibacillus sp. CPCC 101409]MDO3412687.1 SMI1/KNR4 family protein [Saccharibacillus sp. CPCC 101409]
MEEIEELLTETYAAGKEDGVQPEPEDRLAAFEESRSIRLPGEYRELLARFGPLRFAEPTIHGLKEQEWAYPPGMELIADYRSQGALEPDLQLFPIGGFGDGDLLVLQPGGAVYRLYHDGYDDSPLEKIVDDMPTMLGELSKFMLDVYRAMKEQNKV